MYGYFSQVIGFRVKTEYNEEDLNELQRIIDDNRYTITDTMLYLRAECKDLLYRCRWQSKIHKCDQIFQITRTYSGTCCSFNVDQKG